MTSSRTVDWLAIALALAGTAASFLAISSVVRWELGFVGMVGAYYLAGLVLGLGRVE